MKLHIFKSSIKTPVNNELSRDSCIDFLKFVALLGLVLDHVTVNRVLLLIRSFDVNLLVFLSAILMSEKRISKPYTTFYKKRLSRLLLPTWLFLSFYFIINEIVHFQYLTIKDIVKTYLLLNTPVGYVWIVYVYVICALLVPIIQKIDLKTHKSRVLFILLVLSYAILIRLSSNYYYRLIVLYPIIYGAIMIIGMNWKGISNWHKRVFVLFCLAIFTVLFIYYKNVNGHFLLTGEFKYPPRLYYLAYSLGITFLLYEIVNKIKVNNEIIKKICFFYSSSSLWFYLWHILVLQIVNAITDNELLKFVLVMLITSCIVAIQKILVNILRIKGVSNTIIKVFEG